PVSLYYHVNKGTSCVIFSTVTATIFMCTRMSVLIYFVILPAYAWFIGSPEMAGDTAKWIAVIAGILPFNLIKGVIIGALFVSLFIKMKAWIEQKQTNLVV